MDEKRFYMNFGLKQAFRINLTKIVFSNGKECFFRSISQHLDLSFLVFKCVVQQCTHCTVQQSDSLIHHLKFMLHSNWTLEWYIRSSTIQYASCACEPHANVHYLKKKHFITTEYCLLFMHHYQRINKVVLVCGCFHIWMKEKSHHTN